MGLIEFAAKLMEDISQKSAILVPALIGGAVDYLNQLQAGSMRHSWSMMFVHLFSAVFFGWGTGVLAAELGYSTDLVSAASGAGGYMGIRVVDLVRYKLVGDRRSGA